MFRILLYYGAGGRQNNRLADAAVLGEFGPSERVYGVAVGQTGADYKTTKEGEWGDGWFWMIRRRTRQEEIEPVYDCVNGSLFRAIHL